MLNKKVPFFPLEPLPLKMSVHVPAHDNKASFIDSVSPVSEQDSLMGKFSKKSYSL